MQFAFRKLVVPLALASFLVAALFGFIVMSNGQDGRMQGGCPFSAAGASLCPQDAFAVALHHISSYQLFLNVPVDSTTMAFMSALLLAVYMLVRAVRPLLFAHSAHRSHFSHVPPVSARTRKITRWLALLENSPS